MKKKISFKKIFNFMSILFLLSIVGFYSYRLIYYGSLQRGTSSGEGERQIKLYDGLFTSLDTSNSGNGLSFNEEIKSYVFKGKSDKNYIWYSGRLWRVLTLNEDKTITMVTDTSQTILSYGKTSDYNESYVFSWINTIEEKEDSGIFYKSLNKPEEYLVKTKTCLDKIEEATSKFTCNEINEENYVGLLSLYNYNLAGGIDSFLNNGEYYYLSNSTSKDNIWYVFDKGGINHELPSLGKHYGIRTVVTLKSDLLIHFGSGTIDDPFVIEGEKSSELANLNVGEYIEYSKYNWRVTNVTEKSVKLIMDGYIIKEEIPNEEIVYLEKEYSTISNKYLVSNKKSIGYYLNDTFYKSLENNDYLIKGDYYTGAYSGDLYDNTILLKSKINSYVGLPSIGEFFINEYNNTKLLSYKTALPDLIYIIDSDGKLYLDSYKTKTYVRPMIYLDANLSTLSGTGTEMNPYTIGRG